MLFHRLHPERAVRPHAGHDDDDAPFLLIFGQMPEEQVDRRADSARRGRLLEMQPAPKIVMSLFGTRWI